VILDHLSQNTFRAIIHNDKTYCIFEPVSVIIWHYFVLSLHFLNDTVFILLLLSPPKRMHTVYLVHYDFFVVPSLSAYNQ
jgi:hypothetical protein